MNKGDKMYLPLYQIDAFAQKRFEGNPAAVCPLQSWLHDDIMQKIAKENNLSETAFFVEENGEYHIRWFTPNCEVDMCGHATLASAYVLFEILHYAQEEIIFNSKSGPLMVRKEEGKIVMDFPVHDIKPIETPDLALEAFGIKPQAAYKSMDYIFVFNNEEDIYDMSPNFEILNQFNGRGVIVTSKSKHYDFVCRFFAPNLGIAEDPVTGSAFTQIAPYWADVMCQNQLHAKQVSSRGGEVFCRVKQKRIEIAGYAVKYLEGKIEI